MAGICSDAVVASRAMVKNTAVVAQSVGGSNYQLYVAVSFVTILLFVIVCLSIGVCLLKFKLKQMKMVRHVEDMSLLQLQRQRQRQQQQQQHGLLLPSPMVNNNFAATSQQQRTTSAILSNGFQLPMPMMRNDADNSAGQTTSTENEIPLLDANNTRQGLPTLTNTNFLLA